VVAGGLVDEPAQVDLAPRHAAAHAHAAALARPDVLRAVRGDDLDRRGVADLELHPAGHVDARRRDDQAAPAPQRVLAERLPLAVPQRPPRRGGRPDPGDRRAQHQLRPERADPRPALERAAAAPGGHARGRQRQLGPPDLVPTHPAP
jgi:hypothetical protein